jgi:hypothetical protein
MDDKNVAIICPRCGGSTSADDAKDGICTCQYCKEPFYLKDIVSQPKVTVNHTVINNNYGRQHGPIYDFAKDIVGEYGEMFRDTAKYTFNLKDFVKELIAAAILMAIFAIGFWLVYY